MVFIENIFHIQKNSINTKFQLKLLTGEMLCLICLHFEKQTLWDFSALLMLHLDQI